MFIGDLTMNVKISIALAFFVGYFVCDVTQTVGLSFTSEAKATVAGMSAYDLKNDPDFKQAVMSIAEDECKTDINSKTFQTWFYCGGPSSRHAPR